MEHKVLFSASTYSHIRNFHLPYLQQFRLLGWTVHVACANSPETIPGADEVISLPLEKKMHAPSNFRAAMLLRKKIQRERYDLVITHTSLAAFFTRLAVTGLRDRPRVINMSHGYLFDDRTPPLKRQILLSAERLTAGCTDLLLTMNRFDYETACRYRLGREIVNVPGIGVDFSRLHLPVRERGRELRRSLGLSDDAFALIYAAEFSKRKSQSVLIRALQELPPTVVLLLPGSGALLEECRELSQALGVAERVIFPGHTEDMALWYAAADAAISSSRSEGLPFNIMESMHLGLPVIASAVKGHTDLITHGETGLLYPYGDHAACAEQIRALLDSPDLARHLAAAASSQTEQYSLENVLPIVMEQYGFPRETLLPLSASVSAAEQN